MVLTKYLHIEMKEQFPRKNIGQGYSPDVAFRWFLGDTSSPLHGAQKVRKVPSLKKHVEICSLFSSPGDFLFVSESNREVIFWGERLPLGILLQRQTFQ